MRILKRCLWFSVLISSLFSCAIVLAQHDLKTLDQTASDLGKSNVADAPLRSKVDYAAQNLRDPFAGPGAGSNVDVGPQNVDKKPLPALTVQGLIWGGNFPQAIINNKVLKEGDAIEGVKIKSITKQGITVLFEGSETIISSPAAGPGAGTKSNGG